MANTRVDPSQRCQTRITPVTTRQTARSIGIVMLRVIVHGTVPSNHVAISLCNSVMVSARRIAVVMAMHRCAVAVVPRTLLFRPAASLHLSAASGSSITVRMVGRVHCIPGPSILLPASACRSPFPIFPVLAAVEVEAVPVTIAAHHQRRLS